MAKTLLKNAKEASEALCSVAIADRARVSMSFFKTGPGEYAEGHRFIGVSTPQLRAISNRGAQLSLDEIEKLLRSKIHEERALALQIMELQFRKAKPKAKLALRARYLKNLKQVDCWDLVDGSAPYLNGPILFERMQSSPEKKKAVRASLRKLALSKSVWKRRIAVLTTFHFIRQNEFSETLFLAKLLLKDEHDLIHKALGWMLREIAKRDQKVAERFLKNHGARMPRTMLRYAIERFPPSLRAVYMAR